MDLFNKALEGIVTAGPVALILGYIAWKLWQRVQELEKRLIKAQAAHQKRTDKLQAKMLRLAVRVQRAVEALAGLFEAEDDLEECDLEDDEDDLKEDEEDDPEEEA